MAKNHVSTLRKGLLVLELVKEMNGITLTAVMENLEMSKSTAFRILTTLEDMNYIYKIQSKYFFNSNKFDHEGIHTENDSTLVKKHDSLLNRHNIFFLIQCNDHSRHIDE